MNFTIERSEALEAFMSFSVIQHVPKKLKKARKCLLFARGERIAFLMEVYPIELRNFKLK